MAASYVVVCAAVALAAASGVRFPVWVAVLTSAVAFVVWVGVGMLVGGPRGGTMAERLAAFVERHGRR